MYMIMCDPVHVGAVYVYVVDGSGWTLQQTLYGTSFFFYFGWAVTYNPTGSQLAVGAFGTNDDAGMYHACMSPHVYDRVWYIQPLVLSMEHIHALCLL